MKLSRRSLVQAVDVGSATGTVEFGTGLLCTWLLITGRVSGGFRYALPGERGETNPATAFPREAFPPSVTR